MNWRCLFSGHSWTCDADQGIRHEPIVKAVSVLAQFHRYARPWCRRCRRYMSPGAHLPGSENWDAGQKYRPPVDDPNVCAVCGAGAVALDTSGLAYCDEHWPRDWPLRGKK